ncbi:NINE protein [Pyruvatibacter mobilis]|jgi:TM2 domain-containing membrane protein YozV|uniref:NINE protein n=1 Tax=Pyruvatibacter mobilis TaxID=1712261 RepID=A0A845Q7X7_9HYPH|nr:TM2 domain-containing protein [Pyruvatibacter mobilis]NBG94378.1 NINE protein [Pyruvatibacter mobilis]QJD76668.1 TM2 domain-containing protein [Pyruvatibacter mobilis]
MALTTAELSLIEQRVSNDGPSTGIAYLLWFFLGLVSAHRFYLGEAVTAIIQILSYFIFVGFIWLLIDAFLIPGMVRKRQDEIRQRITTDLLARSSSTNLGESKPDASTSLD